MSVSFEAIIKDVGDDGLNVLRVLSDIPNTSFSFTQVIKETNLTAHRVDELFAKMLHYGLIKEIRE